MSKYRLYKFRKVNINALTSLANAVLWFSTLKDLNDPFEGTLIRENNLTSDDYELWKSRVDWTINIDVSDPEFVKFCNDLGLNPDKVDEDTLISHGLSKDLDVLTDIIHGSKFLCMSQKDLEEDPIYENLMWSHYAQGLRGFCLVFNNNGLQNDINIASNKRMRGIKVSYQDQPNRIGLSEFMKSDMWHNDNSEKYIQAVTETTATKSSSWKYENEMRIMTLDSSASSYSYSPDTLEEIVLGEKIADQHKELVLSIAKSKYPNTKIKIAKLIPNTYQIEICDYVA